MSYSHIPVENLDLHTVTPSTDYYSPFSFFSLSNLNPKQSELLLIPYLPITLSTLITITIISTVLYILYWLFQRLFCSRKVYLLDFATYKPPEEWKVSTERWQQTATNNFNLPEDSLEFCMKLLNRSGLGEETYFPPGILNYPPRINMQAAREEAEQVMFGCLDDLFAKTGISPKQIDILIVNCSLFNPTPSLSAMIINKYKMREDINSYNLSGMGCSAGVISLHLANDLLQTYPNSLAVVLSTENITQNIYLGKEKSMLISNTLFRVGGAAVLLSNRNKDINGSNKHLRNSPKYQLLHTVRTHMGGDEQSYRSVFQDLDCEGVRGVRLDKELMNVAGKALTRNITRLGPKILPWSEQLWYVLIFLIRFVAKKYWLISRQLQTSILKKKFDRSEKYKCSIADYVPNFNKAVNYFCIHAGGRAVIDAIQSALSLPDSAVEPSRYVLQRYGNTSSSSIWYEFEHIQTTKNIKKGQKIWQLGFGSGFKCNSAVWKKI